MAFVEAMAIEVVRAPSRPSGRSCRCRSRASPTTRRIERFGSDKPDLRFGMELVDLAPVLSQPTGRPTSGFRVFDAALAAGGRVKAIVAPGLAGASRRQIDELTETAKRFGARAASSTWPSQPTAIRGRRSSSSSARSGSPGLVAGPARRREGDLVLIVADAPAVDADVLGRLRAELGGAPRPGRPRRPRLLLGPPLPDVPVGRGARRAGTPPTTPSAASCPRTSTCS